MSQRLTGLSHEEATGLASHVFATSDKFLGRTSNLVRILSAHTPYLARWFVGFITAVRQPGLGATSDARLRGLACIKTSMVNACDYCTSHTSIYGQGLGISPAQLQAMQSDAYKDGDLFDEREKAVITWAQAMTDNSAARDKKSWEDMKRLFSEPEIVEFSLACAMFNMINRLNDSFWTELEPTEFNEKQWQAMDGLTIEQSEAYAAEFGPLGEAERRQAAE